MTRLILLAGVLSSSCGSKDTSARTEHPAAGVQESVLAKSKLPGASGVGAALKVSDSASARRKLEDSIATAPP